MKTKLLLMIFVAVVLSSYTRINNPEFLCLTPDQLKPLGIEINENGVFYKNINPDWKQNEGRYTGLGFYSTADTYMKSFHFDETETLKASNRNDKLLVNKVVTRNDFYPLLIGNTQGDYSLDSEVLPSDLKMLPVAICMADSKLKSRNDTIVVWFKPTESLAKALPGNIKMEDYLKSRLVKQ